MNRTRRSGWIWTAVAMFALSACTTTPERVDELDDARATVQQLERQPLAQAAAAKPLDEARDALSRAELALEKRRPVAEVTHHAYLARRHAEIGLQLVSEAKARESIRSAESERRQVQLEAREAEAERATLRAERQSARADQSQREAEEARIVAAAAIDEANRLADELDELEAEQTERGLVLTLSDVLFDTNRATLKGGAEITIARLADYLEKNPDRRLLIEGHTDARGSEEYNRKLSGERAAAVSAALEREGIARDRLRTAGLGEAYPVASNDTEAGMQQNRRVEIVISDPNGEFPAAAEQRAALRR